MLNKILVFDMDGTIADLYGVIGWLPMLRNEDPTPYVKANPMYDMDSTKEYDKKVRKAKTEWLKKYRFPFDEIHLVKYGTTKANCTRKYKGYQILVDDNETVRKGWTLGNTINANENILGELVKLID